MRAVIVVLNWNLPDDSASCLRSAIPVLASDAAIVLIDNGSTQSNWQDLWSEVQKLHKDPRLLTAADVSDAQVSRGELAVVRLDQNLGFSAGNNVGLRVALNSSADWVILLNNDCELPEEFISVLFSASLDHVGAIGCQIISFDQPARLIYGGGRRLYRYGVHWLTRWGRTSGVHDVNFVPFACVALSGDAVRSVGLLDERYFAYVEDAEYCFRLTAAGWNIVANLDVRVRHRVSATLGRRSPRYYYYVARNTPLFITEALGAWRTISLGCFAIQCLVLGMILGASGRRAEVHALVKGWMDYFRGRFGPA